MNQTSCAMGTSTSKIENYRPDWLEVTVARAVRPLRDAIDSALSVLGDAPCSHGMGCEGCEHEWREAVRILRGALSSEENIA